MKKKKKVISAKVEGDFIEILNRRGRTIGTSLILLGFEKWIKKRFGRSPFTISTYYINSSIKAELVLKHPGDGYFTIKGTRKKSEVQICEHGIEHYFEQKNIRTLYFKKLPANAKRNNRRNGDR